jgi:hypothetical protein
MSSASNYLEEQIGTHLLRTGSWTKPAALYVALFTTLPAEDGTGGVEVSGTGYARVQHDAADANWTAPTGGNGLYSNNGAVQFGSPTANWGSIVGFGLYDASVAGNYLLGALFASPVTVNDGDPAPAFATGQLTITIG